MDCLHNTTSDLFVELSVELEGITETDHIVNRNSCAVYGCSTKWIAECDKCMKYYCYEHALLDLHNLRNIIFINLFKENLAMNNPDNNRQVSNKIVSNSINENISLV